MPTNLLVNRNNYQSGNPTVFNTKQVDFDGTDDYLEIKSTLGSFTGSVSFWVKKVDNGGGQYFFDARADGGVGYIAQFSSANISVSSGTVYVDGIVSPVVDIGEWHHVVVTGISLDIVSKIIIGTRFNITSEYFYGEMSQIGLWNTTLTADEVSSLYNHGLPIDLTTVQAAYASSSNLVGYWRMGSGTLDTYPLIADQTNATLGSELVTNGDFATDSNWTKGTGWTISGGSANCDGTQTTNTGLVQQNGILGVTLDLIVGKSYEMQFDATITSGLISNVEVGGNYNYINASTTNSYKLHFVPSSTNDRITFTANPDFVGSIDNVSVKEVQGNPAIMTNQTSSDIENGSPYANLIQNTNFTDSSEWSVAGWNITNNQAVLTGTGAGNNLYISNILQLNKTYNIVVDAEISAGSFTVMLGGGGDGYSTVGTISSTGTYTITGKNISTTSNTLLLQSQSGSIPNSLKINSVTLAEVNTGLQGYWKMGDGTNDEYPVIYDQTNPTLGSELVTNGDFATETDWTFANVGFSAGAIAFDNANDNLFQNLAYTVGKTYKLTITKTGSGTPRYRTGFAGSDATKVNIPESGVVYFTATSNTNRVQIYGNASDASLTLNSVSVKEVQGNPATMTNMLEGNITNQYPLTKIRNYYRMGDGILDGYPIIQDQTSPNLAHIPTTNLIPYSEDLTNTFYNSSGLETVTESTTLSPDGVSYGYNIIPTSATQTHYFDYAWAQLTTTVGTEIAFSVFVKPNGYNFIQLASSTGFSPKYQNFELTGGGIIGNGDVNTSKIEKIGDWYRCSITQDATGTNPRFLLITSQTALASRNASFAGNGTDGILAWGYQVEEQNQATAYIKSDGIAAVRKSSTTNTIEYSEDFTQSSWLKTSGVTITSNYGTSPIGTNNSTRLQLTTNQQIYNSIIHSGNTETASIYVKGTSGQTIQFGVGANISQGNTYTLNGEWQRINHQSTSGSVFIIGNKDATATDFEIWGAQLEEQTQAETYAPTKGLPVTIDLFKENNYGTMTNMSASNIVEDTP
jgi:hypothetical protein